MILVAFFLNLGIGRKHLHTTRSEAITSIIQQRPLWIMQKGNRRLHSCISAATLYAGSCNVWLNAVSIPPSTSAPVFIARLNRREILTWRIPLGQIFQGKNVAFSQFLEKCRKLFVLLVNFLFLWSHVSVRFLTNSMSASWMQSISPPVYPCLYGRLCSLGSSVCKTASAEYSLLHKFIKRHSIGSVASKRKHPSAPRTL